MLVTHRQAYHALLAGLAAVVAYHGRQWRRDRALADRRRAEAAAPPKLLATPRVSALVAAWNEGAGIEAHIGSFLALRYPNIELIICAGGDDDTYERARSFAGDRVTVLEQRPGEGKQAALARCLEHARGEIIYLTDADCRFDDEVLAHVLAPLVNGQEQAATGASRPRDDQLHLLLPRHLWSAECYADAQRPAYCDGLLGRNAAIVRPAIERIGGLSFAAPTGTDFHLAMRLLRAGLRIRFVPESVVASHYPVTLSAYRRKQSRWLRNLLLYSGGYRAYHHVRNVLQTGATGALMLLLPLGALALGPVALVLWALLYAHAGCAKVRYALFAVRLYGLSLSARHLLAPWALSLVDFVVWISPFYEALLPERRSRW